MNGSNIYEVKYNGNEICMIKCNGSVLWENYITIIDYEVFEITEMDSKYKPMMPWFGENITLDNILVEEEILAENVTYGSRYPDGSSNIIDRVGTFYRRKIKSREEPTVIMIGGSTNHETNSSGGAIDVSMYYPKVYELCDFRDVTDARGAFNKFNNKYSFNNYNFDFLSDKSFRKVQSDLSGMFAQSSITDSELAKMTGFMSKITGRVECDCSLMFNACTNLTNIPNIWGKILPTNMMMIFYGCTNLTTVDLSDLDLSNCTRQLNMFSGCTKLTTLRLDNCSNDTINKIITSSNFPTFTDGTTHNIYCKQANVNGLTPPTGWTFTYVD